MKDQPKILGRRRHTPTSETRAQVSALVVVGASQTTIAKVIGISVPTLRQYYARELENAVRNVVVHATITLFEQAKAGNFRAQKMWLKRKAGWGQKQWGEKKPLRRELNLYYNAQPAALESPANNKATPAPE